MVIKSYKRLQLSVQQLSAVDLLAAGRSDSATAEILGCHPVTLRRWRALHPAFQAALNSRRAEIWIGAADQLRALLPRALEVLRDSLDDPETRLIAAVHLVKMAGLEKLGAPVGETDGERILDSLVRESRNRADSSPIDKLLREANGDLVTDAERMIMLEAIEARIVAERGYLVEGDDVPLEPDDVPF